MRYSYVESMGRGKNLDRLRDLDLKILDEVVREGEQMMATQLAVATAADQRALTWAGFVITIALAAFGASATLANSNRHLPIAVISGLVAVLMAIAGFQAILSVRPQKYALPGNRPENWLPDQWEAGKPRDIAQARIEQARCLNNQIADNILSAELAARRIHVSIDLASITVLLAGVYVSAFVLWTLL